MATQSESNLVCCPELDPTPWDDKFFEWTDKKFIRDHVFTLFYKPVNFSKAMVRLHNAISKAGEEMPGWLCLSDHTSKWNMDI